MYVSAIVAAGGRGQRLGGSIPKQLLVVSGRSVLERSVAIFLEHPRINEVVVALPADLLADPPPYLRAAQKLLRLVPGGARRQDSVANAFQAVSDHSEVVVVHDAARPFASSDLVTRTIEAAAETGAALAALPARDTVKRTGVIGGEAPGPAPSDPAIGSRGAARYVSETIPRDEIYLAQTPQAFRRQVLREALALSEVGVDATDEASLAERNGHPVQLVAGEPTNIKITTREDLAIAEAIARGARTTDAPRAGPSVRIGTGYDLHRLVTGRPLILAGLTIPFERGLLGHSDADAICHAATDAVLGAAAVGDIGRHFPDTDPRWKGARSVDLLRRAAVLVRNRGYDITNVDIVVIAERPKLAGYVDAMCASLADALGVPADRVSIKGKTNEGIGDIGNGDAIAVHAVALVHAR